MMAVDIKIVRKDGFILNPKDEIVNNIFRLLGSNHGHCPTVIPNRKGHDQCPCEDYLEHNKCHCGLYIKKDSEIQKDEWGW